jgi:nitrite reductase/ring-hydroxylating ferredoxin subunit
VQHLTFIDQIPSDGLRFTYRAGPFDEQGILLRLADGSLRAYKNECRHLPMALDSREPRTIWDASGRFLYCCSHGALYRPEDGLCVQGPCEGSHLKSLPIRVEGEAVVLLTSEIRTLLDHSL